MLNLVQCKPWIGTNNGNKKFESNQIDTETDLSLNISETCQ